MEKTWKATLSEIWNSDLRRPFVLIFISIGLGILSFIFNEALEGDTVGLFSRSGSLIVLCGAIAEWRLYAIRDEQLVDREGLWRIAPHRARERIPIQEPTRSQTTLTRINWGIIVLGTVIWGYGDLFVKFLP